MKLTKDVKQRIDAWFESKSAEEVSETIEKYGIKTKKLKSKNMKYRVGDVVKLKSKEELEKIGWSKYCATELEGAKLNILGMVHDLYITAIRSREIQRILVECRK